MRKLAIVAVIIGGILGYGYWHSYTQAHFAESLGAVVKTVRQGKKFLEETRLVDLTPSLTDPKEL